MVKNLSVMLETACHAGDIGSFPGSGRSLEEGNGNSLQYSCHGFLPFLPWKNPMDRGALWATVCGVIKVRHNLAI